MTLHKSARLLLVLLALTLVLVACRRGQTEAVPTLAPVAEEPTAAVDEPEGAAQPTEPADATAEPEPTAEAIVARPVPVEEIDWPPQVIASDPAPGGEIPANAPITVRFDQPMDQASVEAAFAIAPDVSGDLSWPEPSVAVFTPAEALTEGETYNVTVADTAASLNGQTLPEPVAFNLQTTGPLAISQTSPEDGATSVGTDAAITVVFNKPVVPLVASGEQAGLPQPLTFDPPVEGTGEWTSTSIYRFVADPALAGATTYTVRVDPALTDVTGSVIENPPTFSFTTVPPTVVQVEPENAAVRISPTTPITVTFNMPMDPGGVEGALSLSAGDAAVSYTTEWQEENRVVVLTPDAPLPLETTVTLTVGAAAPAANGGAGMSRDHISAFDTVPFPAILSTFPENGAVADVWQRGFNVEFASPMNDDTVVDQFIIEPDPGEVDYFVNEWEGGYSVFLDFPLEPNTTYTVTIPATAADPYGNTLGEEYVFTFSAPPFAPLASLNLPRDVAQLSTSFPTTVQVLHRNVTSLDVSLYDAGVDTSLLFNAYQINERQPEGEPIFQTTLPVENVPDELGVVDVALAGGGVVPTGIYELRVNAPEVDPDTAFWQVRNVLLIVGDTNLVIKEMFGEVNVWATDLATGQPASGRDLTLYKRDGEVVGTAVTDANGFARFDYTPDEAYLEGVAVVSNEPGAAGFGVGSTLWTGTASPWQLGITTDSGPEQALYAYIYTDRPIFRPGDTVYYKGIVRTPQFGRYALPDIDELELSVNPNFFFGEGADTFSETLTVTLDADGVFHGELVLPDDMPLGTYSFNLTGDFWLSSRPFTVAEYRAPEFQVTVTADRPELLRGEAANVTVEAAYLFGGSAAGLPVNWTIYQSEFVPAIDSAPGYIFGDQAQFVYESDPFGFNSQPETVVGDGSGETDAAGRVVIPLPADLLDEIDAGSRNVRVEATVGGLGEFPVSGRTTVVFHAAEVYVGLRPSNYLVNAGDEAEVDLLTVDWAGEPLAGQPVEVAFYRRDWESERVEEFGTRVTVWTPEDTEVGRQSATTDDNGQATVSFTPEEGGTYLVVATVTDGGGRQQFSSTSLWSIDDQFTGWRSDPNRRTMDLTLDKSEYLPGETAQILVQSPFAQPVQAWLTVERGNIIDQQVITIQGSETIALPITADYAPNVHVTITAIKPVDTSDTDFPYADIRVGYVEIVVPPDQFDLTVTLTPGAEEYAPGDTAAFDIAVTDQAGNGVQSEVSLALVDLAVLLLKEDNAPPILEAFYFRQPLRSVLGSGLLITGEGLAIEEPLPGGGFGGGGGAEDAAASFRIQDEDDVRQDFKDTAYWEAKLITDENGQASVEIPLPDNVTTWRLHSKAATNDTEVGQASVDILARLPLIIRPITPRFFTAGDQVLLGANVNNNTDADIEATVSLEASGLVLDGEAAQTVTIPAGGREVVRWNVTVEDVEAADLTFRVEGGGFSDASKPTIGSATDGLLPVYRYDGRDFVATAGELDGEGRRVEALVLPQGVDTRRGEAVVRLQPSLAAAILESFDIVEDASPTFLECPSTLADRLLHNTAIEAAIGELELDMADLLGRLQTRNADDTARLLGLQRADGGWGWCFSDDADPWLSAQSLLVLTHAAELGYPVDDAALTSAASYLRAQLDPVNQLGDAAEANRQAFFLYVMAEAGADVVGEADELVGERRDLLDPYAKALLALAYAANGAAGDNQEVLLTDLNDSAIMSATGAHWESDGQDFPNLDSNIRGTAMVISALTQLEPDSPLLPPAVRWLMVARQAETWATLHQTAWSVSALSDWMVVSGELEPDYAYELQVNLQPRASGSFTAANATASETVTVPLSELVQDGTNFFDFQRGAGDGRLYYTLRLDSAIAVDVLDPISRGFTVERRFYDAACDPVAETCEPIDSIPAGGRVRVELTVIVPNDRIYVMVEDPIPAGTDAIDPNLLTSASGNEGQIVPAEGDFARGFWGWWYFDHIQYRDEKVVFLSQFLPAGTYQYSYFLQPNIPGTYQVMPATAREQYFPEVFGRSEGAIFTITE